MKFFCKSMGNLLIVLYIASINFCLNVCAENMLFCMQCVIGGVCGMDDILCGDGSCVPVLLKCNGVADCSDGADEVECNRK